MPIRKKTNPFVGKNSDKPSKKGTRKAASGKRVGKSRPEKANNQLNRRVK